MKPRSSFKRLAVSFGWILWLLSSPATAGGLDPRLAAINDWLYVLQPEAPASPAAIAESDFDLVVMDYSADGTGDTEFAASQIAAIQASGKVALAYLSIGEAESYRFYWDPTWNDQVNDPDAPNWLGEENPDFPGNYKVRFWFSAWKANIFGIAAGPNQSYLDRIIDQGFDGIYLDIIDAYYYWSEERCATTPLPCELTRQHARAEMLGFLLGITNYARVTRGISDFLVLPQNGLDIIWDGNDQIDPLGEEMLALFDGCGVEDVFWDEVNQQPPGEVTRRIQVLSDFLGGGERIALATDYVWDDLDPTSASNISRYNNFHTECLSRGYLPYAATFDRDLDEIIEVGVGGGFTEPQPKPPGGEIFFDGCESGNTSHWSG